MPKASGHGPEIDVGNVALYLCVSSDEQRERESTKIQREFFEQYCKLYGIEVTQTYADDVVSDTDPLHERPEGRRLLEDARAKKFETLLGPRQSTVRKLADALGVYPSQLIED